MSSEGLQESSRSSGLTVAPKYILVVQRQRIASLLEENTLLQALVEQQQELIQQLLNAENNGHLSE